MHNKLKIKPGQRYGRLTVLYEVDKYDQRRRCLCKCDCPIRPSCQESFITRGTYQMLANRLRVGWHPEFQSRLVAQSAEDNL